jgi:hypothetical protein
MRLFIRTFGSFALVIGIVLIVSFLVTLPTQDPIPAAAWLGTWHRDDSDAELDRFLEVQHRTGPCGPESPTGRPALDGFQRLLEEASRPEWRPSDEFRRRLREAGPWAVRKTFSAGGTAVMSGWAYDTPVSGKWYFTGPTTIDVIWTVSHIQVRDSFDVSGAAITELIGEGCTRKYVRERMSVTWSEWREWWRRNKPF